MSVEPFDFNEIRKVNVTLKNVATTERIIPDFDSVIFRQVGSSNFPFAFNFSKNFKYVCTRAKRYLVIAEKRCIRFECNCVVTLACIDSDITKLNFIVKFDRIR